VSEKRQALDAARRKRISKWCDIDLKYHSRGVAPAARVIADAYEEVNAEYRAEVVRINLEFHK